MKINFKFMSLASLFIAACLTISSPANAITANSNSEINHVNDDINNAGKKDKKKKKKKSRRKCTYCPPMRTFEAGQMETIAKAGLVATYAMDNAAVKVPPMSIGLNYRVSNKFSFGFNIGHSVSASEQKIIDEGVSASWTNRHFFLGFRPGVHITSIENWDFYGGLSIGMHISNIEGKSNSEEYDLSAMERHMGIKPNSIAPAFFGFVGVRYVLTPKWMLFCEAGYEVSIFSIGGSYLLFD